MHILRRTSVSILVLLLLTTLVTSIPASVFAAPLTNTAPNPADSTPTNGAHVFFIRKNPNAGAQKDIRFSAYLPAGANIGNARLELSPGTNSNDPSVCEARTTPAASGANNNQFIRVRIQAIAGGAVNQYYIRAANACSQANQLNQTGAVASNVLYARYAFPGNNANVETQTNMIRFDVTIEYGTPTPDNAGGIRMVASIPSNGNAVISPGTNGLAYPIVADWDLVAGGSGVQHIAVPFGLCEPTNVTRTKRVAVYDADNGPTQAFYPATVNFRIRDLTTNTWVTFGAQSDAASNATYSDSRTRVTPALDATNDDSVNPANAVFEMNPSHFYEMRIYNVALQNTIDIEIAQGSQAIWGDSTKCVCPPTVCTPPVASENVVLTSFATGGGDVELGGSVTFSQGVAVSNFPNRPSQWGFNEEAVRRADNTNTPPVQTPYNANNAGATGETAAVERQCQTGWAGSCANYTCDNGSIRTAATGCGNAVGGYRWRCAWNGKYDPQTGWTGGQNAPSCPNIVQYQCRDAAGNWQNQYRDFSSRSGSPGCPNQWNCWAPSNRPNTYDPNYGAGYCRVFKCAYDPNPAAYFYSPPGNDGNDRCDKRCSNGAGAPAPNWTGTGSDDNCYIQPSFTVTCTWQNNGVSESYVVTNNGNYCGAAPLTLPATSPGQLCAVTVASNSGWSSPPPGKGVDGNPAGTRVNWGFEVFTPAQACARVGLRPYFHAYGGDVNAAASFGPACTQNPTTIRSFNNGTAGNNVGQTYTGSGSQLGVFSRGAIDGFTSKSQSATLPLALTFANTPGGWGGNWANNFCIPDNEWQQPDNTPSNVVSGGLITTKDSRYYGSDDVYITGNTSYPATYALANVPLLKIVTRGNVYIAAGVTDFSGVIMTTGKIYTCAVDNGAGGLRAPSGPEMYANCGNQLRVRGSFVADQVKLLRTVGTVRYATPNPATAVGTAAPGELFFYTPETWMQSPTPTPGTQNQIESLVNLPPVL